MRLFNPAKCCFRCFPSSKTLRNNISVRSEAGRVDNPCPRNSRLGRLWEWCIPGRTSFKGLGPGAENLVSEHLSSVIYWPSILLKLVFLVVYGIRNDQENKNTAFVVILNRFSAFWDRKSSQLTHQIFNFEISIFFSIFKLIFRSLPGLGSRNKRYQQIGRKK